MTATFESLMALVSHVLVPGTNQEGIEPWDVSIPSMGSPMHRRASCLGPLLVALGCAEPKGAGPCRSGDVWPWNSADLCGYWTT